MWARIQDMMVDDARDFWTWWSTWLAWGSAIVGGVAAAYSFMPSEFQNCVGETFPRWVVIGLVAVNILIPLVRMMKQPRRHGPVA